MNFLAKNYRPKCDMCSGLCDLDWYMQNLKKGENIYNQLFSMKDKEKDALLLCENCFETGNYPKNLTKEDFELGNFFNIVNPSEKFHSKLKEKLELEKWTVEETMQLIDSLEKHGENWEEIIKV